MIAAISARVMSPLGSIMVLDLPYKRPLSTAALTASAYQADLSKSRKSVVLRLGVVAADTLTASDKHDTAARNNARIRFFFTLNTS